MLKRILSFALVVLVMFVMSAGVPYTPQKVINNTASQVVSKPTNELPQGVLKARFENMLNHNFVYGDDFTSDKVIIENSILALLDKQVDGEIERGLVVGFIADLYGRQVNTDTVIYDFCPASEGMIAIIPRGYSEYKHNILSITESEGGFDVVSQVTISTHDGEVITTTANTVIVPNEGSAFGYNIISSEIL